MKQAKADRAELNKLTKAIEERRKMVKAIINKPYDVFEAELKEILALIQEPVGIIDKQVKAFENQQKEEKKKGIRAAYDEVIGDLAQVLPFEKVFDSRYLNQTYKLATAQADIKGKVEKVRTDLETIDSLESKYKLNAKDIYIKTLDLSKALAENKRLSDLEVKLEAEKRRKAEEEAERKRLAEERRKEAEEKARVEEERRKMLETLKNAGRESAGRRPETVTGQPETVIGSCRSVEEPAQNVSDGTEGGTIQRESVAEPNQNVSDGAGGGTFPQESEPEPATVGNTQVVGQQTYAAVDPFAPKREEKRYRTKFCAVGTRAQLQELIRFMNENDIEYGRIK